MAPLDTQQVTRSIDRSKELAVAPVYLAGETERGEQRVITPLTEEYGWSRQPIGGSDSVLDSPCRRVRIAHLPSHTQYAAAWIINVAQGPMETPRWQAAFDHGTPPELVAAVTGRLAADFAGGGLAALYGRRHPHEAIGHLERAGWDRSRDPGGTGRLLRLEELWDQDLLYTSPDNLAAVRRRAHVSSWEQELAQGPEAWEVSAGPEAGQDPAGRLWRATFTSATPTHLVAGLTAALADPGPVFRDGADLLPELEPLLVTTANFTRPRPDQAKAARTTTTAASTAAPVPPTARPSQNTRPSRTR
ncbi:DUF317 domain-containing protein [Kitasatospora sp. NPDC004669]|uniref:DUF317 domain-containing protein n=1 Tax=Kitasatospora sp. NPDC004669 TaxID=3154555 RepID=UPI0033A5DB2E